MSSIGGAQVNSMIPDVIMLPLVKPVTDSMILISTNVYTQVNKVIMIPPGWMRVEGFTKTRGDDLVYSYGQNRFEKIKPYNIGFAPCLGLNIANHFGSLVIRKRKKHPGILGNIVDSALKRCRKETTQWAK